MNQQNDYNNVPSENFEPQKRYITYIPYGMTPETYEERKEIRKTANTIGGSFLIVLAVNTVLLFIISFIYTAFSVTGIDFTNKYLEEPAFLQVLQVVFSVTMFTFPFILLFKARGYRISGLVKFKKPKREDFLPFFLIGVAFCAFANISVNFMGSFFASFGINYEVSYNDRPDGFLGFLLTLISTAIVPALVEEFACRGIVLGSLRKYGEGFAIVASAILFGLMHGNFEQMPFAFLSGLILGFITVKTNTLWIAMAVHFFNNMCSVVFEYLFSGMTAQAQNIIYAVYLAVCLLVGIFGIFMLKNKKTINELKETEFSSEPKKIRKWFYTSPTIIIFAVICFIRSFEYFK